VSLARARSENPFRTAPYTGYQLFIGNRAVLYMGRHTSFHYRVLVLFHIDFVLHPSVEGYPVHSFSVYSLLYQLVGFVCDVNTKCLGLNGIYLLWSVLSLDIHPLIA